jgi:hypothetical protein
MQVWTIQPMAVWEQLRQRGHLRVDEARLPYGDHVPEAYQRLTRQLALRLPEYPGTLPWWAHCRKPDLRWFRHHTPRGQPEIRLEIEPRPGDHLTFPCWAWDTIHSRQYVAPTYPEYAAWTAALRQAVPDEDTWPLPEPWRSQLEASWERLFDPGLPARPWDGFRIGGAGSREAVLTLLRLDDVRKVTPFIGAGRLRPPRP